MRRFAPLILLAVTLAVIAIFWRSPQGLVVYCAHDAVYSEAILKRFERETGIPVSIRFDTEATKSLGLVDRLLSEKARPQCDVFWNNELLGTMALAEAGVLEPYKGSGYARIPETRKHPDGLWTGFAARFRVWIINREKMPGDLKEIEATIQQSLDPKSPNDTQLSLKTMTIAVPLYGTTLTHYSALWNLWGSDRLQAWHRDAIDRGLFLERNGNGGVMNRVARGRSDFGWTDTDDFFVARDDQAPVELLPVRIDGKTIAIPNTVAVIRGAPHREAAHQLVDFLLSEDVELELARSKSRQVPLGKIANPEALPEDVRQLHAWVAEAADLRPLLPARNACLDWLKQESLR
jgi:iron(III) transport system substrate-binding protein